MVITLTMPMLAMGVSALLGWTGFLLGAIKWLLNRQLTTLEAKIDSAERKANSAVDDLSELKDSVYVAISKLQTELHQTSTCSNHPRMEDNTARLFARIDQLHGDFRQLNGAIDIVKNQVDLMYQHHLNGGG